jgi:hypothetical protein
VTFQLQSNSAAASWEVIQDDSEITEGLRFFFSATTDKGDDELREFTERYEEAHVTLMPLRGAHRENEKGEKVVGIMRQDNGTLYVRLLVEPIYLTALTKLLVAPVSPRATLSLTPHSKLWEWNGEGFLYVKDAEVTVRFP